MRRIIYKVIATIRGVVFSVTHRIDGAKYLQVYPHVHCNSRKRNTVSVENKVTLPKSVKLKSL